MNKQELQLILQEGEGYKIEFKENISNIDKNIVAFVNSSGGRIFIGITDDKKIFDKEKFEKFLRLAKISRIVSTENILISLGVAEKQEGKIYFNNAGILFFAKEPQKFIPWSVFTVALKIRIEDFWVKPKDFKLGETIFRRNHVVSDLFGRIHFGEKIGTGLQRMKDICKRENAPPPQIEYSENYFYITFKQSREYLKIAEVEKISEGTHMLNERQNKAVEHVKKRGFITISEYISLNKVSDKTARRDLNELVESRIFMKEGVTTGLKFKLRSTSVNFGQGTDK